ncbi:MAG TPA: HIT family protein [bacterium]|nr:HIT family protein [bacterium]
MSEKSIFTRIVEGEIPCYKIYEDDLVLAFLDINPIALGHTLVIPKAQIDRFEDVPAHIAANLFISAQKIARAIKQATGSARIGMVIAGFDVPHTHIHLIPANTMADIDFARASKREDAEMKEVMERIILSLS